MFVSAADDPYGLEETVKQVPGGLPGPASTESAKNFFSTRTGQIVGIVLSFIGVIFLILIIYAGITWMTAAGNEQQIGKAKDIIIAAVIGLVIVLSAYAITNFIGTNLTT